MPAEIRLADITCQQVTAGDGNHAQCGSDHLCLMWITFNLASSSACIVGKTARRTHCSFGLTDETTRSFDIRLLNRLKCGYAYSTGSVPTED